MTPPSGRAGLTSRPRVRTASAAEASSATTSGRGSAGRATAQERFDRRVHARRRRTWKLLAALALVGAAAWGSWWVLWRSDWLVVEEVAVSGVEARWEAAVLEAAGIGKPQPMVEVDTGAAASAVEAVPVVKDVKVRRSWPSTITLEVTPRTAVLAVADGSGFSLVDDEGVTIEKLPEPPAGIPTVLTRGEEGATPDAYRAAWVVLSALPESFTSQVTAATVSSADLLTFDLAGRTVVWGGAEDSELKLEVAEALLASGAGHIDVSAPRTPVTRPS